MTEWVKDEIQVSTGLAVPCFKGKMLTSDLKFYARNPRVYSQVWQDGENEPDQEIIYTTMKKLSHVSELRDGIKRTGGTRDEVIVLEKTSEVIEGNRRLAVYKWLSEKDPKKWGEIPVKLIKEDLDEATIFSLLSAFHLTDQSMDWSPFERAGLLYRRNYDHGVTIDQLHMETSISKPMIKKWIDTYSFMQISKVTDAQHYSHCEQFRHNKGIRDLREEFPGKIEEYFVKGLQQGTLPKATELRDKLGKVIKANPNTRQKFADGKIDLDEAYERMLQSGGDNSFHDRIKKFNEWYLEQARISDVKNAGKDSVKRKMIFVVKKLDAQTKKLKRELGIVDRK
jgi:hypothetical protein